MTAEKLAMENQEKCATEQVVALREVNATLYARALQIEQDVVAAQ